MKARGWVLALFVSACSGSAAPADLGDVEDLGAIDLAAPTTSPPAPPVSTAGGPTLHAMQLYTIVWPGDEALGAELDTFHAAVLSSSYWTDGVGEYGVGPGAARGVVVLPGARPATLDDQSFTPLVHQLISSGQIPLTSDTVLAFLVGKDLKRYGAQTLADYCNGTNGYHAETFVSPFVPYIVDLQCPPSEGLTDFENLTWTASHELAEVATDPHPASAPAWTSPWLGGIGEVCDLCNDIPVTVTLSAPDGGAPQAYSVAKVYSGVIAASGTGDPCQPVSPGPYYNVAVEPSNIIINTDLNGHGTAQVTLIPFTNGAPFAMQWYIYTTDAATVTPASGSNSPGDMIPITITTNAGPQSNPSTFTVLITDPNNPAAWGQEWTAALTIQ